MIAAGLFAMLVVAMLVLAPDLGRAALRFLSWLFWLVVFAALSWASAEGFYREALFRAQWLASGLS